MYAQVVRLHLSLTVRRGGEEIVAGRPVYVVHAERYRRRDRDGDDPRQSQHDVDATRVLVLGVLDRLRHGDESMHRGTRITL